MAYWNQADIPGSRMTPQDAIGFINQVMDMFPNNDTVKFVSGSTHCSSNTGQTIVWWVGDPSGSPQRGCPTLLLIFVAFMLACAVQYDL